NRRACDAFCAWQAARQRTMGGGGGQRGLDDARQCARADALRRRGRRLPPRLEAWRRLAADLDRRKLAAMTETIPFDAVFDAGKRILKGETRGRLIVKIE